MQSFQHRDTNIVYARRFDHLFAQMTLATYREWSEDPRLGDLQVKDMTLKTAGAIYQSL
jgi:hypothetical protein